MLPIFNNGSDEMTSATSMDISESFRPEDLSKTDFFDFVTAPPEQEQESNQGTQSGNNVNSNSNNDQQPLQGFDQVSVFVQFIYTQNNNNKKSNLCHSTFYFIFFCGTP